MADAKPNSNTQQRIRIRLKAYDHKVIDQSAKQIVDTAIRTGATVAGPIPLPTKKTTYTVIKSPHIYKKGREQFEMRIHKRLIDVHNPTPKTIDSLMNLSLPAGCDAEIKMQSAVFQYGFAQCNVYQVMPTGLISGYYCAATSHQARLNRLR